jgi:hypothetical protein
MSITIPRKREKWGSLFEDLCFSNYSFQCHLSASHTPLECTNHTLTNIPHLLVLYFKRMNYFGASCYKLLVAELKN